MNSRQSPNPFRDYARSNYFNGNIKTLFAFFYIDIDGSIVVVNKSAGVLA